MQLKTILSKRYTYTYIHGYTYTYIHQQIKYIYFRLDIRRFTYQHKRAREIPYYLELSNVGSTAPHKHFGITFQQSSFLQQGKRFCAYSECQICTSVQMYKYVFFLSLSV